MLTDALSRHNLYKSSCAARIVANFPAIVATHMPGEVNMLADALSRLNLYISQNVFAVSVILCLISLSEYV